MTTRIGTAQGCQPTLNRHAGAQTNKMPMVAIESHHMDSLHGPTIVSPLNLLSVDNRRSNRVSGEQTKGTQIYFEHSNSQGAEKQSTEVQTDFTSFTRQTHYCLPKNYFDKYVIVDSCEDLAPQEITQKAKAFNKDFFTRFGGLFPIKFIIAYFGLRQRQSNL